MRPRESGPLYQGLETLATVTQEQFSLLKAPLTEKYFGRLFLTGYFCLPMLEEIKVLPEPKLREQTLRREKEMLVEYLRASLTSIVGRVAFASGSRTQDLASRMADKTRRVDDSLRDLAYGDAPRRSINSMLLSIARRQMLEHPEEWPQCVAQELGRALFLRVESLGPKGVSPLDEFYALLDGVVLAARS